MWLKRNLLNGGLNLEHQADNFYSEQCDWFQYLYDQMNLDQDFTEADIYTIMQKQNSKTISEELVLKSKPGNRWQWTTGSERILPVAENRRTGYFPGSWYTESD